MRQNSRIWPPLLIAIAYIIAYVGRRLVVWAANVIRCMLWKHKDDLWTCGKGCLCPVLCQKEEDWFCSLCARVYAGEEIPPEEENSGSTPNENPTTQAITENNISTNDNSPTTEDPPEDNPTTEAITDNNVSTDDGNPTTEDPTEDNSSTDNANPTNIALTTNDGNPITEATIDGNTNHITNDNSGITGENGGGGGSGSITDELSK